MSFSNREPMITEERWKFALDIQSQFLSFTLFSLSFELFSLSFATKQINRDINSL